MSKRIEPNLVLGQMSNLLKTNIAKSILTPILLQHERHINISVSTYHDVTVQFEIDKQELNEILGNFEYYYKKRILASKMIHQLYLREAPIHQNGCPITYEEWIDSKVENMELSKNEKEIFEEWNNIINILFSGLK